MLGIIATLSICLIYQKKNDEILEKLCTNTYIHLKNLLKSNLYFLANY